MMVHEQAVRPGDAGPQVEGRASAAWITRLASPLAGLCFAAKDNIDVAGVPTTAACLAFARTPSAHAHVVQRLLDAGASLLQVYTGFVYAGPSLPSAICRGIVSMTR